MLYGGQFIPAQTGYLERFFHLATGARRFDGAFLSIGIYSGIWSSTEGSSSGPWYRFMEYWSPQVSRTHNLSSMGRPVRCLRDE